MPEVGSVEVQGEVLTVVFDDGHKVVIVKDGSGWTPREFIETFTLQHDGSPVAEYLSPRRSPKGTDRRNGFVLMGGGYNVDRAASYWSASERLINRLATLAGGPGELADAEPSMYRAYLIVFYGHEDLQDIKSGRVEVHAS